MDSKLGVDSLKIIAADLAKALNCISKFIHKQGLIALWGLLEVFNDLKSINWDLALQELRDVDGQERLDIEASFNSGLDLVDKTVQAKIVGGVGYVEKTAEFVAKAVSLGKEGYAIVLDVKAFLGL